MSARLIDGKAAAARLLQEVAQDVAEVRARGIQPALAVILVGSDPASQVYVRNKLRRAAEVGIRSLSHELPADLEQIELLALIAALNADPEVHGILVQLPLPPQIDEAAVLQALRPDKDVDGFHRENVGALALGQPGLVPCTPAGCLRLLQDQLGDLSGRHAVVVGRSNIVGKPMAALLLQAHCTVTLVHSRSRDAAALCRQADILVAAAGQPGLVTVDWVKPGAVVIDVGINRVEHAAGARLVGDVAPEVAAVAGALTPVPGGVGPMTIALLLHNTLSAAQRQHPHAVAT